MAISILSSTNYSYTGQADSRAYSSSSGTNTLLVVCVSGFTGGTGVTPSNRSLTYNSVAMTEVVGGDYITGGSGAVSTFSYIYTLVNPATGSNTLAINYSNGTNWGINVAVYTLGNVSNAPVSFSDFHGAPSYNNYNNQTDTITHTPTSSDELCIDTIGFPATPDSSQTSNGNYSTRKYTTGLSSLSMVWSSTNFYPVGYSHSVIFIRNNKDFSLSDSITSGDSVASVKGILLKVTDMIMTSDVYTHFKRIFINISDTIIVKNRGWFGKVYFWISGNKNTSDVVNDTKHSSEYNTTNKNTSTFNNQSKT